jgi:hypothetical protein
VTSNPASKSPPLVASALYPVVHRIIAAVLAPPGDPATHASHAPPAKPVSTSMTATRAA